MSNSVQTIIVIIIVALAVGFLFKKFIYKPKSKKAKACGNDGCGC